jgi:hypothetical protein
MYMYMYIPHLEDIHVYVYTIFRGKKIGKGTRAHVALYLKTFFCTVATHTHTQTHPHTHTHTHTHTIFRGKKMYRNYSPVGPLYRKDKIVYHI